jgi:hypothetical protein
MLFIILRGYVTMFDKCKFPLQLAFHIAFKISTKKKGMSSMELLLLRSNLSLKHISVRTRKYNPYPCAEFVQGDGKSSLLFPAADKFIDPGGVFNG